MGELVARMDRDRIDWRLFSNEFVLAELRARPEFAERCISPSDDENAFISSSLAEWADAEIAKRTQLVRGEGEVAEFYRKLLERIRGIYRFDLILLWSENGAVRRFADDEGLPALHLELGPTRAPFPETIYVDYRGTNGSASFLGFDLDGYPAEKLLPAATWLGLSAATDDDKPSVIELQAVSPSLPFDIGQPYVVVALQLADDLNTICHSRFATPKAFLQAVLPPLTKLGFKVIVKGHPGSSGRPVNLIHEIDALAYAREFGDEVVVIDRNMPPGNWIPILSGAAAVGSINSSVSFEALLLGVPGLVFGVAAFDIGLHLKRASEAFLQTGQWNIGSDRLNRLVTVLCRHILHPKQPRAAAAVLQRIIEGVSAKMVPAEFMALLRASASHGDAIVDDEIYRTETLSKLAGLSAPVATADASYMGYVDRVKIEETTGGCRLTVEGWVARRGALPAIRMIALRHAKGDIVGHTDLFDRADVRKIHPSIDSPVGFAIQISLPRFSDAKGLRFLFISDDGVVGYVLTRGRIGPHQRLRQLSAVAIDKALRNPAMGGFFGKLSRHLTGG
jgi:hypothetical protein